MSYRLLTPGLDNTCLFMSLTAGAGTSKKRRAPVRKRHEHEGTVPLGVNQKRRVGNSQTGHRM